MDQGRRHVFVVVGIEGSPGLDDVAHQRGEQNRLDGERGAAVTEILKQADYLAKVALGEVILLLKPYGEADGVGGLEGVSRPIDDDLVAVGAHDVGDDVDVAEVGVADSDAPVLAAGHHLVDAVIAQGLPDGVVVLLRVAVPREVLGQLDQEVGVELLADRGADDGLVCP